MKGTGANIIGPETGRATTMTDNHLRGAARREQVEIIFSAEQERAFESQTDRSGYFKQRYVEGTREYTAHLIALNGNVVFSKCYWFDFHRSS